MYSWNANPILWAVGTPGSGAWPLTAAWCLGATKGAAVAVFGSQPPTGDGKTLRHPGREADPECGRPRGSRPAHEARLSEQEEQAARRRAMFRMHDDGHGRCHGKWSPAPPRRRHAALQSASSRRLGFVRECVDGVDDDRGLVDQEPAGGECAAYRLVRVCVQRLGELHVPVGRGPGGLGVVGPPVRGARGARGTSAGRFFARALRRGLELGLRVEAGQLSTSDSRSMHRPGRLLDQLIEELLDLVGGGGIGRPDAGSRRRGRSFLAPAARPTNSPVGRAGRAPRART